MGNIVGSGEDKTNVFTVFRMTCLGTRLETVQIIGLKVLVLFLGTPQLLSMYQS